MSPLDVVSRAVAIHIILRIRSVDQVIEVLQLPLGPDEIGAVVRGQRRRASAAGNKTTESCKKALGGEVSDDFKMHSFGRHTHKNADVSFFQRSGTSIPALDHNGAGKVSSGVLEGRSRDDSTGRQLTHELLVGPSVDLPTANTGSRDTLGKMFGSDDMEL